MLHIHSSFTKYRPTSQVKHLFPEKTQFTQGYWHSKNIIKLIYICNSYFHLHKMYRNISNLSQPSIYHHDKSCKFKNLNKYCKMSSKLCIHYLDSNKILIHKHIYYLLALNLILVDRFRIKYQIDILSIIMGILEKINKYYISILFD